MIGSTPIADRSSRPVLLVDDDAETRSLLSAGLESFGIRTIEAANGFEGIDAARAEFPGLLAIEVCLPDVSGFEVCHEVRTDFGDAVSIVLISACRTDPLDRVAALLIGADDYLVKPFGVEQLVRLARAEPGRPAPNRAHPATVLTARELEVLRLLAEGLEQPRIAELLAITPKTVATHIERILNKLGAHSRAKAIALAYQTGLMDEHLHRRRAVS
jgi:DNA-binding NarL/FixJ family response regulator